MTTDKTFASFMQALPGEAACELASFDTDAVIGRLKQYLPAQAPLKDFIHHNTLHAFQDQAFDDALASASAIFGHSVYLSLAEYRTHHHEGRINDLVLNRTITSRHGAAEVDTWRDRLLNGSYPAEAPPRTGALRALWRKARGVELDARVQPELFRMLCGYLDQGISIWRFPAHPLGLLASLRHLERLSFTSIFRSPRARHLLLDPATDVDHLLGIVVGDGKFFEHYLFDQQFAHPGWSGMVAAVESAPETLLDQRSISLRELITFELLLEIDALDTQFGESWEPLCVDAVGMQPHLFGPVTRSSLMQALALWHEAFEWSYYDGVLSGMGRSPKPLPSEAPRDAAPRSHSFQSLFCIDDRECSLRRHLERADPDCSTFGTPGFFGVAFYYQPYNGKFFTKLCPAPVTPTHLIKETASTAARTRDHHFGKNSHRLFSGWLIAQTLGLWSAMRLFLNVFRPSTGPASSSSFRHMARGARLTIESPAQPQTEQGLQVGFTVNEMADRVEKLLGSIGLVRSFAPIVYVIGHGSSSVNNPHYAAYDCGACCGRPGSVNARVLSAMANHAEVRRVLRGRGIDIPAASQFVGGLHDTSRDEIVFYDENALSIENAVRHERHGRAFQRALTDNAKERSRRFDNIDQREDAGKLHERMKLRSVSLFQPRPELNHANNALCIVGRRELSRGLFLDRRAFLNSYDHRVDPQGDHLYGILKAAAPVCGGINLEYFFSRVDNQKLGAGTKLPHNVMGLVGVANGMDGDLRPGLPSQMIELHDPVRLLLVVEHRCEVVLEVIKRDESTCEWFANGWVQLAAVHPESREVSVFREGRFQRYSPVSPHLPVATSIHALFEASRQNIPVHIID